MARDAAVGSVRPSAKQAAAGSAQSMRTETSPWTGEGESLKSRCALKLLKRQQQ